MITLGTQIQVAHREELFQRCQLTPVALMVSVCAATGVYGKQGPAAPWVLANLSQTSAAPQ